VRHRPPVRPLLPARPDPFSFRDGLVSEIRVFQQDTHLLLATLEEP
jgi:hypothetical protein